MTSGGPDEPAGGFAYPPLDDSHAAQDYPADAGLPPPIYPAAQGYPGAPGYYPGYDPYRPVKPPGTNGKAIASIVCSGIGVVSCCLPVWIVGFVLGIVAMRETRRTGQDGYGVALAGVIVGGLATAGAVLALLGYVALIASDWSLV